MTLRLTSFRRLLKPLLAGTLSLCITMQCAAFDAAFHAAPLRSPSYPALFKTQTIPPLEVAAFRNEETQVTAAFLSREMDLVRGLTSSPVSGPSELNRHAAKNFLKAMGLDDLSRIQPWVTETSEHVSFFRHAYRVVRMVLPADLEPHPQPLFPEGLAILPRELGPTRTFELLYREGRLIGIYAIPSDATAPHQRFRQMDLTHLYIDVPVSGRPDARARWQALVTQWEDDSDAITSHRRMTDPIGDAVDRFGDSVHPRFLKVEVNKESGVTLMEALVRADVWNAGRIEQFMDPLLETVTGVRKFILPVVPGVFVMTGYRLGAGLAHYRNLYRAARHYAAGIAKKDRNKYKSLLIGPGTGVDSCILQLATGQRKIYTIGSASENANTKTTAQANGFDTESRVHDNIVSPQGTVAYPGERFHLISWFMPWIDRRGKEGATLQYADKDGAIFHQFVRSLPQVLDASEDARVMIGNIPQENPEVKNEVIATFEASGFVLVKEDSVPKEGFYVFKQALAMTQARTVVFGLVPDPSSSVAASAVWEFIQTALAHGWLDAQNWPRERQVKWGKIGMWVEMTGVVLLTVAAAMGRLSPWAVFNIAAGYGFLTHGPFIALRVVKDHLRVSWQEALVPQLIFLLYGYFAAAVAAVGPALAINLGIAFVWHYFFDKKQFAKDPAVAPAVTLWDGIVHALHFPVRLPKGLYVIAFGMTLVQLFQEQGLYHALGAFLIVAGLFTMLVEIHLHAPVSRQDAFEGAFYGDSEKTRQRYLMKLSENDRELARQLAELVKFSNSPEWLLVRLKSLADWMQETKAEKIPLSVIPFILKERVRSSLEDLSSPFAWRAPPIIHSIVSDFYDSMYMRRRAAMAA